jgi:hypothetical protein
MRRTYILSPLRLYQEIGLPVLAEIFIRLLLGLLLAMDKNQVRLLAADGLVIYWSNHSLNSPTFSRLIRMSESEHFFSLSFNRLLE